MNETPKRPLPDFAVELPDGLLELPWKHERPRIQRHDAAVLLDLHLRRLARLSGAVDRGLALRLRRLKLRSVYLDLGFSGLTEYARERLGLAPRTTQALVRLGHGLVRCPAIGAALQHGQITWTAAAEALRVATPENEETWLEEARTRTVRALKQRVDEAIRALSAGAPAKEPAPRGPTPCDGTPCDGTPCDGTPGDGTPCDGVQSDGVQGDGVQGDGVQGDGVQGDGVQGDGTPGNGTPGDGDAEDDDPIVRMATHTSGTTARLWDAAVELAQHVAGSPLSAAAASEYLLADYLSGTPCVREDGRDRTASVRVDPVPKRRSRPLRESVPAEAIGGLELSELYSAEVAAALRLVDGEVPDAPHELDASARTLVAAGSGVDLDLARLLRNFSSLQLHRHIGFDTFKEYVRERLAISSRRAGMLVRLDHKLYFLPQTGAAVREGRIGLVAADLIARVANPETEQAWVAVAEQRTVSRLRKDVDWVLREADRSGWRDRWPPPPDALPSTLDMLTSALCGEQTFARDTPRGAEAPTAWIRVPSTADWRERVAAGATGLTGSWPGNAALVPKNDENGIAFRATPDALDCRPDLERAFVRVAGNDTAGDRADHDAAGQVGAALVVGDRKLQMFAPVEDSLGSVKVRFELRESALSLWNRAVAAVEASTEDGHAPDAHVLREVAVAFLIDHLPLWLEALAREDTAAVRARFTCEMPGCDVTVGTDHHVRFRSQLGCDELWNLMFVCFGHHVEGVHRGRVRIYGEAPNRLVVELGLRRDGTPLARYVRFGALAATAPRRQSAA